MENGECAKFIESCQSRHPVRYIYALRPRICPVRIRAFLIWRELSLRDKRCSSVSGTMLGPLSATDAQLRLL